MSRINPKDLQVLLLEIQPEVVASSKTVALADLRKAAGTLVRLCEGLAVPGTASIVPLGSDAPTPIEELAGVEASVRNHVSPFDDEAVSARLLAHDQGPPARSPGQ